MSKKTVSQKYADLILKENQEAQSLQFTVSQSALQGEADLLAVQQQISTLEQRLVKEKSTTTGFSLSKIAETTWELNRLMEVYALMQTIKAELF